MAAAASSPSSSSTESLLHALLSTRAQRAVRVGGRALRTTTRPIPPDPPLFRSLTPRTILAFYFAHCDLEMESPSRCPMLTHAPFIVRLLEQWYIQEYVAVPLVQALIDVGAKFDVPLPIPTQRCGIRPLALALNSRRLEIAKVLIAAGADVSAPMSDDRRLTPLKCAAENDHSGRLVELLLEAGAPVEEPDVQGWTTLIHAVHFRNIAAMYQCHRFGCDLNHADEHGMTPMMHACHGEDICVVAAILDMKGPDGKRCVNLLAKNHRGRTALDIIAASDSTAAQGIEDTLRAAMGLPRRWRCTVS